MSNKITYLFGAGASANCLPIVKKIPQKLLEFIEFLESNFSSIDEKTAELSDYYDPSKTYSDYRKDLISDLKWLIDETKAHSSIDTYAKKLSLQGKKPEMIKLKTLLTIYFSFEQLKTSVDIRYDSFFASLLSSIKNLPENITIITWNYDSQFELSFSEFIEYDRLSGIEDHLRIRSKDIVSNYESGFGIYKINGTARNFIEGSGAKSEKSILIRRSDSLDESFLRKAIDLYSQTRKGFLRPSLSFAWERSSHEKSIIDKAARAVQNSNVLVVIGYSFPFFNREIDKTIIQCMGHLEKVYIQDPNASKIMERFNSFKASYQETLDIVPIEKDLDQFFLPYEL